MPAAEARLPVFRTIFADIGDEQSIAANLSTFSWHITNIAGMDRSLALPALVLLDELGAGTDPLEGGALGVAIIDHFRTRGAIVISTTHYEALKTYAATTPGVTAAAFGFTPDTYEPTYHIQYGSPGRSLALEMAGRLGLNGDDHRQRPEEPVGARSAARRAPRQGRYRSARARARAAAGEARAGGAWGRRQPRARARRSAAAARRDVQAAAQREARRAPARRAGRNRRDRRRPEEAGGRAGGTGGAQHRGRAVHRRHGPPARRCARRGRRACRKISQRPGAGGSRRGGAADAARRRRRSRGARVARPRRGRRERARPRSGSGSARQALPLADERAARARRCRRQSPNPPRCA